MPYNSRDSRDENCPRNFLEPLDRSCPVDILFIECCRRNEVNKVTALMTFGADVNWRGQEGWSGLHLKRMMSMRMILMWTDRDVWSCSVETGE